MNENKVIEESAEVVDEAEEITEEEIEDTAEESDEDFDFEYDDEGNIIVPEDEYDEGEEDNSSEDEDAESEEEAEEETEEETSSVEEENSPSSTAEAVPLPHEGEGKTGEGEDERDAEIARLRKELEDYKSDTKAAIKKLGGTSDDPLDDLERMAAETEGKSLDKYRADRASEKRIADAQALIRNQQAETIFAADLAELHANYPETRKYKHVREMPVKILHDFAKARNAGFTAKKAYAAAIADENGNTGATAVEKQAQHDSKAHLKSSVPKSSKDTSISLSKKELAEARNIFPDKSDKELQELYKPIKTMLGKEN